MWLREEYTEEMMLGLSRNGCIKIIKRRGGSKWDKMCVSIKEHVMFRKSCQC